MSSEDRSVPPIPFRRALQHRLPQLPAPLLRRGVVVALVLTVAAGCGTPPELRQPTAPPSAQAGGSAAPSLTGTPPASPSLPGGGLPGTGPVSPTQSAGLTAVACTKGPSGQRVTELVRGRAGLLPRNAAVRVRTGPLCAGDWHYTVLDVAGYERLSVVTEGPPRSMRLVTAGTDVCTIEVRVAGPPAIRTLACDGDPAAVSGA